MLLAEHFEQSPLLSPDDLHPQEDERINGTDLATVVVEQGHISPIGTSSK